MNWRGFFLGVGGVASIVIWAFVAASFVGKKEAKAPNYEWFYIARTSFETRIGEMKQFKTLLADEANDEEDKTSIRGHMMQIQQSCRDLVRRYNAHAEFNRALLRSQSLPESLNEGECG
jgi:hypothetical protein